MQTESAAEVPVDAANALVAHLRQHPEETRKPPADLAERFDLPVDLVRSVLAGVAAPEPTHYQIDLSKSLSPLKMGLRGALSWFATASRNPLAFVLATTLVCVALSLMVAHVGMPDVVVAGLRLETTSRWITLFVGVTMMLHLGCYYLNRMARHALYGAISVWVVVSVVAMVEFWFRSRHLPPLVVTGRMLSVAIGLMVLSAIYAGLGSFASVLGSYRQFRRQDLATQRLSRQELLERYFELQERLSEAGPGKATRDVFELPAVKVFERSPLLWSILAGVLFGSIVVAAPLLARGGAATGEVPMGVMVVYNLAFLGNVLVMAAIGFFSRSFGWAILAATLYALALTAPLLVPAGLAETDIGPTLLVQLLFNLVLSLLIASVAVLGGNVQRRAIREKSLRRNDPAALMAEMVRIQWRLTHEAKTVCVMVVDAAKSSRMKAEADPLTVEFSFGQYQAWIANTCRKRGGTVQSTMGDGAVVAFPDCASAFWAARRLQTDVDRFNREQNRLEIPFRLRIGLHRGEVSGDLDEVQFTEVIDIAAHIQAAAPVAGIAVSEDVASELPEEDFIPLAREVDGRAAFLALDPLDN
jgi:class 3 adenylate cyclase